MYYPPSGARMLYTARLVAPLCTIVYSAMYYPPKGARMLNKQYDFI
jgi:hypothetical protein